VLPGIRERKAARLFRYIAFVDPSGGSSDAMTAAIAHREGDTAILDAVRERQPPFSPEAVVSEFADLCRSYRVAKVYGDRYAGESPREQFRKNGVNYDTTDKTKSEIFLDLVPLINSRGVDLLDSDRLVEQLAGLERRTSRGGRDLIDYRPGGHDDIANAAAGALLLATAGKAARDGEAREVRVEGVSSYSPHRF
jgi:hypothetical protein